MALALISCTPTPSAPPTPTPVSNILSTNVTFKSYTGLGFPEQDVFIEPHRGSSSIYRFEVKNMEKPEKMVATYQQRVMSAKNALPHDPYKTSKDWQGPFEPGVSLRIALQQWTSGQGIGRYSVKDGIASLKVSFWQLMNNGKYSLWCSRISKTAIIDKPCMPAGQPGNPIVMNKKGQFDGTISFPAPADTTTETGSWISLAYHSDGHEAAIENDFGKHTHVQLLFRVPTPAEMRPAY